MMVQGGGRGVDGWSVYRLDAEDGQVCVAGLVSERECCANMSVVQARARVVGMPICTEGTRAPFGLTNVSASQFSSNTL